MNKIIDFALRNRLVIIIASVILLLAGTYTANKMEVDVFPDLTAPTVVIMTEAHGMAPEEVERLVTFPIETTINGATNIRRVRSSSALGFSLVWAEFDWGTDIYNARQTVTERLIQVNEQLPEGVGQPVIAPQSSLMGEIILFGITSDKMSPLELRTFADWNIRPRLLSVGGTAQIIVHGGEFKQYQILLQPEKMRYYGISMDDIVASVEKTNDNSPGGFISQYGNKYIVRGLARTNVLEELGNTLVKMKGGKPIVLNEVADLVIGPAPKIGDASYNGSPSIMLTVTKQPNINTIDLTKQVHEELKKIEESTKGKVKFHMGLMEQADFIQTSIDNVQKALIEGSVLVIIILFVFLMNLRTTIISVLAIPLSLLTGIIILHFMGITINTMTLGGMAIAIGSLVDDAIIDVENVYKRLRQNYEKPKEEREKSIKIIYEASKEIRSSILNATLIIIAAFIPLFFLSGMEGLMLRPLGIAYVVSLFASLFVALTVTPVLCSYLLTGDRNFKKKEHGSRLSRALLKGYQKSLEKVLHAKKWVLGLAVAMLVGALVLAANFGRDFLPPLNEGSLTINFSALPGISLDESNKIGTKAEKILLSFPEIEMAGRRTGRAELAEHSFGINVSEVDVPFILKDRSRSAFLSDLREKLSVLPGVNVEVGQPITHRINHMLSGSKAAIAIKLFGTDLNQMYTTATQIKAEIGNIDGIGDLNVQQQIEIPQFKIRPKRDMLAKYGIPVNKFTEFIDFAFAGEPVSNVFEEERSFDLVVRYADSFRDNMEAIRNAEIDTWDGKKIPLSYVAEIESSFGANTIERENVRRKLVVSVNVADRDVGSVVADIKNVIKEKVELPQNYWIEYGGQFKNAEQASRILAITSVLALMVIIMLLYQEFKSFKLSWIIMLNLPLALIGGIVAVYFSSKVISIPAIIGFITLFGIATRNGILLISRYQSLQAEGESLYNCVVHGSVDRLNPILMTALTAALALIPLAMNGDQPGNEIQSPMAIVILGGLLSSTLLNVYVVPVIYQLMNRKTESNETK